jgi:integrase
MTPFRSHGKGTLVLKGTFAGVHIERASGTNDAKRLRDLRAMCRTLADGGRLDVLAELAKPRGLKPLEVWAHYRAGDWSRIPTVAHLQPFKTTFEAWQKQVPGERHRSDLELAGEQLTAAIAQPATVAQLPDAVTALRLKYERAGAGRQFNKLRDAASAFIRQTLTRQHPLYLAIRAIEPLVVTRKYGRHPQDPAAARVIAETLGGEAGRIWWILCGTGMGPKEFWTDGWQEVDGHLHVRGQKRSGRDRLVPLIVELAPPVLSFWGFSTALRRSGLGVTPYDARRSFAFWMELARIWDTHQQAYLGHGHRTITDLYRGHDVTPFLDEDAQKLLDMVVGKVVGSPQGETAQVVMSRPGIEPGTYGLKVRLSRSPHAAHSGTIDTSSPVERHEEV